MTEALAALLGAVLGSLATLAGVAIALRRRPPAAPPAPAALPAVPLLDQEVAAAVTAVRTHLAAWDRGQLRELARATAPGDRTGGPAAATGPVPRQVLVARDGLVGLTVELQALGLTPGLAPSRSATLVQLAARVAEVVAAGNAYVALCQAVGEHRPPRPLTAEPPDVLAQAELELLRVRGELLRLTAAAR